MGRDGERAATRHGGKWISLENQSNNGEIEWGSIFKYFSYIVFPYYLEGIYI